MKYDLLGNSNIQSSRIILGCMRIFDMELSEVESLIREAVAQGINLFDHADIYGKGKSEEVFGKAFTASGIDRKDVIIQSKCGIRPGYYDFSYDHIMKSVETSLDRLKTDYLDILILHRPDTLMDLDEVAKAMNDLIDQGKILHYGLSNMNYLQVEMIQQAVGIAPVTNQLQFGPAHTGLIDSGINVNMYRPKSYEQSGMIEYARLHPISIQAWSPFQIDLQQGPFFNHEAYSELTTTIQKIAAEKNSSFEAIVTSWVLRHPAKMFMVAGTTNIERLKRICSGTEIELSREEWYEIYRSAGNPIP